MQFETPSSPVGKPHRQMRTHRSSPSPIPIPQVKSLPESWHRSIANLFTVLFLSFSSSSSFSLSEKLSSFFLLILLDFSPSVWTSLFCSVSFSFFPSISFKRRQTSAFVKGHWNSGQFVFQSSCGGHSFDRRLSIVISWWFDEPPIVHSWFLLIGSMTRRDWTEKLHQFKEISLKFDTFLQGLENPDDD